MPRGRGTRARAAGRAGTAAPGSRSVSRSAVYVLEQRSSTSACSWEQRDRNEQHHRERRAAPSCELRSDAGTTASRKPGSGSSPITLSTAIVSGTGREQRERRREQAEHEDRRDVAPVRARLAQQPPVEGEVAVAPLRRRSSSARRPRQPARGCLPALGRSHARPERSAARSRRRRPVDRASHSPAECAAAAAASRAASAIERSRATASSDRGRPRRRRAAATIAGPSSRTGARSRGSTALGSSRKRDQLAAAAVLLDRVPDASRRPADRRAPRDPSGRSRRRAAERSRSARSRARSARAGPSARSPLLAPDRRAAAATGSATPAAPRRHQGRSP